MSTKPSSHSQSLVKTERVPRVDYVGIPGHGLANPTELGSYLGGFASCKGVRETLPFVGSNEECAAGFWQSLMAPHMSARSSKSVRVVHADIPYVPGMSPLDPMSDPFQVVLLLTGSMKHALIKRGMPAGVLTTFVDQKFPGTSRQSVFQSLGLSDRTVRRKAEEELLSPQHTDAAFALMEVTEIASEVLGGKDAAVEWLTSEAIGLDNQRPIDLLSTSPGIESVKTLLNRIRFGVYA